MDGQGSGRLVERAALAHAREGGEGSPTLFAPWAEWDAGRLLEMCILSGCDYLSSM